jgi:hypothetical protein
MEANRDARIRDNAQELLEALKDLLESDLIDTNGNIYDIEDSRWHTGRSGPAVERALAIIDKLEYGEE